MPDHQPLPVKGYTEQPAHKVELVNENKILEEKLLRHLDNMAKHSDTFDLDARWYSIARTHFEQGFMALNRAIFRPERVKLLEDEASA